MGTPDPSIVCELAMPLNYTPSTGGHQKGSTSVLTIDDATGLIALTGFFVAGANKLKCLANLSNCTLDISGKLDRLRAARFVSTHIFGSHSFEEMGKIQTALWNQNSPPAIVSIDQELGIVNRFAWMDTFKYIFPSLIVASGNVDYAEQAGYITGQVLKLYGINLNFAPFIDLHTYLPARIFTNDPNNPDPKKIALYAGAFASGLQRAGVGACAKHFPDGSEINTHNKTSRIDRRYTDLHVEERYQPLINNGLAAIMVGHDTFTTVDPNNPASLSKIWLTDILRDKMHFQGLIVTDGMEMGAIGALKLPKDEIILRAFEAGADLILSEDPKEVRKALKHGVATGRISKARLCESAYRIQAFAKHFPINPPMGQASKVAVEASLISRAQSLYNELIKPTFGGCQLNCGKILNCQGTANNWFLGGMTLSKTTDIQSFSGIQLTIKGIAGQVKITIKGKDNKNYIYVKSVADFAKINYIPFEEFKEEINYQPQGAVFDKKIGAQQITITALGESAQAQVDFTVQDIRVVSVPLK